MNTTVSSVPAAAAAAAPTRRVKDAPTRAAHWWIAASFVVAYITGDSESWRIWHVIAGYSMVIALVFRIVWGLVGPQSVALTIWGRRMVSSLRWLREQFSSRGLQAWTAQPGTQLRQAMSQGTSLSIVVLIAALPWLGLSGYITYQEITGEWMAELHEWLGNFALFAVLLHLGVLLVGSLLRGQNLVRPMLGGRQPGSGPDLVPHNRAWLALLLSLAMVAFGGWYWQDARSALTADGATPALMQGSGDAGDHDDD